MQRGSITRLIDVILIILTGFLAVADLDDRAGLALPPRLAEAIELAAAEDAAARGEAHRHLSLTATGRAAFELELRSSTGLNRPLGRVLGADTLRAVLLRLKRELDLEAVDVQVLAATPVQTGVDAVDACDLAELPREVRFHRADPGPAPAAATDAVIMGEDRQP